MSDSMNRASGLMGGVVVGSAGHIDHGKTSLIRTLTGIDTDRLAEEKKRGISIDLGFAHFRLPNGKTISFIDVPGHERFIKNMLAGAGGIQAVMLVVAANESVMPQTREHFDICRMLGIERGFVALTKTDLANAEEIEISRLEIESLVKGSFLEGSPVVAVSAKTGAGMSDVVNELTRLAESFVPQESGRVARLAVDRSFGLAGFGTVATGTLLEGEFHTGETLRLHPSGKQVRIRGLQVHGESVERACPGQRTAVNLAGIESAEVRRGFALTASAELESSGVLDASVEWLSEGKQPLRQQVLLHIGTSEVMAALKILQSGASGAASFTRLWLAEPALALPGDRFILRRPSPSRTVAGGVVVDAFPLRRLNRARTVDRLQALATATESGRIRVLVEESTNGRTITELVRLTGYRHDVLLRLLDSLPELLPHAGTQRVLSKKWLSEKRARLVDWLAEFHRRNPSAVGATVVAARELEPELFRFVTDQFPAVRVQGETIALATHKAAFSDQEGIALGKIENAFRQAAYQPPSVEEVLRAAVPDQKAARALLDTLLKSKKLVKVSDGLIFHADAMTQLRASLAARKGKTFSVPEFKDWTQMSRKFAIPVLEYLDREKVTRRVGDQRVVV
jgi:selenocysteine-specific elongation factor